MILNLMSWGLFWVLMIFLAVFGFDQIFFWFYGFQLLLYGFAVSNTPQCPPPVVSLLVYIPIYLPLIVFEFGGNIFNIKIRMFITLDVK